MWSLEEEFRPIKALPDSFNNLSQQFLPILDLKAQILEDCKKRDAKHKEKLDIAKAKVRVALLDVNTAIAELKAEFVGIRRRLEQVEANDQSRRDELQEINKTQKDCKELLTTLIEHIDDIKKGEENSTSQRAPRLNLELPPFVIKSTEEIQAEVAARAAARPFLGPQQQAKIQQEREREAKAKRDKEERAAREEQRLEYFKELLRDYAPFKKLERGEAWKEFCRLEREGKLPRQLQM